MESINKLLELSAMHKEMADKFILLNKELVFNSEKAKEKVSRLIEDNKKLTDKLDQAVRDIDAHLRQKILHEQELEDSLQLNTEMNLFIAILAHDLRSPFNSLLNISELLSENIRQKPIDEIEDYTKLLNKSAHSANDLLNDILMWVQNSIGTTSFNPKGISFLLICQMVIETLSSLAYNKNITINCNINCKLQGDPEMIKAIFRNLVSNAIKYTPKGGTVNISSQVREKEIVFTVADTGIGIDDERLSTLFDISKIQSTSGTSNEKGTGLGLIICKQFVEKHGGKLWVESNRGKGSTFYFSIPKIDLSEEVSEATSS